MKENFKDYKKLDVWIYNYELTMSVYRCTLKFPTEERFGLTQQVRRASVSIISNLAEGCGRQHKKEKIQFFCIAKGSLFEVESQIAVAFGLGFISTPAYKSLYAQIHKCQLILNGFINYHKNK